MRAILFGHAVTAVWQRNPAPDTPLRCPPGRSPGARRAAPDGERAEPRERDRIPLRKRVLNRIQHPVDGRRLLGLRQRNAVCHPRHHVCLVQLCISLNRIRSCPRAGTTRCPAPDGGARPACPSTAPLNLSTVPEPPWSVLRRAVGRIRPPSALDDAACEHLHLLPQPGILSGPVPFRGLASSMIP